MNHLPVIRWQVHSKIPHHFKNMFPFSYCYWKLPRQLTNSSTIRQSWNPKQSTTLTHPRGETDSITLPPPFRCVAVNHKSNIFTSTSQMRKTGPSWLTDSPPCSQSTRHQENITIQKCCTRTHFRMVVRETKRGAGNTYRLCWDRDWRWTLQRQQFSLQTAGWTPDGCTGERSRRDPWNRQKKKQN